MMNYIFSILAALVGGVLLERFRNRLVILKKSVDSNLIAQSQADEFWGNVSITYNNEKIEHLHNVSIEIINDSKKDIDQFEIWINSELNTRILKLEALNTEDLDRYDFAQKQLDFQDALYNRFKKADPEGKIGFDELPQDIKDDLLLWYRNKYIDVPFLNRKSKLTINLLLDSPTIHEPNLLVNISKKGVKLTDIKEQTNEELGLWYIGLGYLFIIIVGGYLIYLFPDSFALILWMGGVGIAAFWVGALIYQTFNYLKQIIK